MTNYENFASEIDAAISGAAKDDILSLPISVMGWKETAGALRAAAPAQGYEAAWRELLELCNGLKEENYELRATLRKVLNACNAPASHRAEQVRAEIVGIISMTLTGDEGGGK